MRPGPCSADHGAGRRHRRPVRGRRLPGPQPRLPLGLAGFIAAFACLIAMNAPQAVWQAGGATALFIAGFGAAGYASRRDLSALARILFWALQEIRTAPLLAASIFLDILNVFLLLLSLFSGSRDEMAFRAGALP